jgi:RHS repeat-associated protein
VRSRETSHSDRSIGRTLRRTGYNGVVNGIDNKYKFQGKEFQDELQLNVYDMEARNYMPDIGRWGNMDELAEKFHDKSPYNFCNNNPIVFSDPSGFSPESIDFGSDPNRGGSNYFASTVVNNKGEIIDYKDDGDDNIYLNSRQGRVIGKEQEDKEYVVGDYLERDDLFSNAKLPSGFLLKIKPVQLNLEVSPLLGEIEAKTLEWIVYLAKGGKGLHGIQYVGITSQFAIRQATHLRKLGIDIRPLLKNLSKADARAVEQTLIELYKLGGKEGQMGQLLNKINSIAKANPAYAEALTRGAELLKSVKL